MRTSWSGIDAVAGIESRGFILAAALAARRGKGFVLIRKQGKLPPPVVDIGIHSNTAMACLRCSAVRSALLVDDVLATGGTMRASAELCGLAGYEYRSPSAHRPAAFRDVVYLE